MTCTGRGEKLSSNNEYPTPQTFAYQAAEYCHQQGWIDNDSRILEPCAGEGRLVAWLRFFCPEATIHAVEINPRYQRALNRRKPSAAQIGDYLDMVPPARPYNLIITNPPFAQTEQVVRKAMGQLALGGRLVMLQRLGFLAGKKRNAEFWPEHQYSHLLVCSSRPKFLNNATDSADYAWFVFVNKPAPRRQVVMEHLPHPSIPKGEPQQWLRRNVLPVLQNPNLPRRGQSLAVGAAADG